MQEEQKRERERVKELEKVSNPVDKEKLELKFDNERLKVKQKVKALVKKHADDIEKLKSS